MKTAGLKIRLSLTVKKQTTGSEAAGIATEPMGLEAPDQVWIWSFIRKLLPSMTTVSA